MPLVLDGTNGVSGVDGTASNPSYEGTDSNTGIFFPAADTIAFAEGGAEIARFDSSGNFGVGTSTPTYQTQIYGTGQTTAALTDAGNKGGSLLLNTPTVSAGDGGALLIGAGGTAATPFAAIKGLLADGAGNTTGSLAFSTRATTGATALTQQAAITAAGLFQFNSGYGSVATAYGCRAWINFNGTGTPAIRASGNVSTITDNGTGDYAINFATAMPDENYGVVCLNHQSTGNAPVTININTSRTSSASLVQISTTQAATRLDTTLAHLAVFR